MTTQPPARREFTDCLGCGKRVATTAPFCRHCKRKRTPSKIALSSKTSRNSVSDDDALDDDDLDDDDLDGEAYSHGALGLGGYSKDDLDESSELAESKSTKKNLWWYVALVLLIVFSIGAFFPWF